MSPRMCEVSTCPATGVRNATTHNLRHPEPMWVCGNHGRIIDGIRCTWTGCRKPSRSFGRCDDHPRTTDGVTPAARAPRVPIPLPKRAQPAPPPEPKPVAVATEESPPISPNPAPSEPETTASTTTATTPGAAATLDRWRKARAAKQTKNDKRITARRAQIERAVIDAGPGGLYGPELRALRERLGLQRQTMNTDMRAIAATGAIRSTGKTAATRWFGDSAPTTTATDSDLYADNDGGEVSGETERGTAQGHGVRRPTPTPTPTATASAKLSVERLKGAGNGRRGRAPRPEVILRRRRILEVLEEAGRDGIGTLEVRKAIGGGCALQTVRNDLLGFEVEGLISRANIDNNHRVRWFLMGYAPKPEPEPVVRLVTDDERLEGGAEIAERPTMNGEQRAAAKRLIESITGRQHTLLKRLAELQAEIIEVNSAVGGLRTAMEAAEAALGRDEATS